MDVPQLIATYLYMRFKSLAPYYSAFIVVLCIYLYSEHKLKEVRNLQSFSNLTTKFSSGQTTSVPLSATPPTPNDVSQPIWRNFILNGIPDSQIDMNDPEQINLAVERERVDEANTILRIQNENLISEGKWNGWSIVIQVHNRLDLLRECFKSIAEVKGIEQTLLIVSIDTREAEIISFLESVSFAPLLIIYHPYSMAFFKGQYPETDINDCTRDQKTNLDQCNSAAKPDSFGHYREAKYSQIKLHWIWKLNFIYQKIKAYKIDRAIFLEEDHFLTTDALHVAQQIIMPNIENCRAAGKICLGALGTYTKNNQKFASTDALTQTLWVSGSHNMGMVIDRTWYDIVRKNAFNFCFHDDYNWDFSLMAISKNKNWQVFLPQVKF